jgi:SAM-dependent methyltransferase
LSLIPVIQDHFGLAAANSAAYELSTYGATLKYLENSFASVTVSEYIPSHARGSFVRGILNQDVQDLTFSDSSFDLVTSNMVFEHVPDDIKGYGECLRILRPGGVLIFTVPLYNTPSTVKLAELTSGGIKFLQEPEYHDSRIGGPKSALTFWRHSVNDICSRVKEVGFSNVSLVDVVIAPSQGLPSKVVYAVK